MDEFGTDVINTHAMIMGTDIDGGSRVHSSISEDVSQTISPIASSVADVLYLNRLALVMSAGTDLVLQTILPRQRQRHCRMII